MSTYAAQDEHLRDLIVFAVQAILDERSIARKVIQTGEYVVVDFVWNAEKQRT